MLSERQLAQLLEAVASLPAIQLAISPPAQPPLKPGAEAALAVELRCTNKRARRHALAPRFPKPKVPLSPP